MQRTRKELEEQRKELLQKVKELSPWMEGSVVLTARRCGKKNCSCHSGGHKHPVMYITGKEKGKTVSVYVPRGWEAEARGWVENHRLLKKLIRDISDIQKQILKLREK